MTKAHGSDITILSFGITLSGKIWWASRRRRSALWRQERWGAEEETMVVCTREGETEERFRTRDIDFEREDEVLLTWFFIFLFLFLLFILL